MRDYDINWQLLKKERHTQPVKEDKPVTFLDAERFKIDCWYNNSKNYKLSWREGIVLLDAWFDYKEHKGLWRANENRVWEELLYQYRQESGITVTRQTARTDQYENLINLKFIEVLHYGKPIEGILIVDGSRLFTARPQIAKQKYSYSFSAW